MPQARVLLADSSGFCLDVEKWFLKASAVTIFTAGDGVQALELARKVRPNLVYLEYSLPSMDGVACCRAIKADPKLASTPVVLVIGASGRDAAECREAGCDAVLVKPLERRQFLETGRAFLNRVDRRELRIPCRLTVACRMPGKIFYGTIEDVSINGIFVGSTQEVEAGETLDMKFLLPGDGNTLVETAARVTWVNGGKRRRKRYLPVGFGVSFLEMETGATERVQEFIERSLLRQHPPEEW
jgi:CheY-like chemotaxis protein